MQDVHYSSKTNEWATPQDFFDKLNAEFGFTLDVAATPENAKCQKYFTRETNGLERDWDGEVVWMNPPYGREIGKWVEKAMQSKSTVVCLIPAKTETRWWALFWDYNNQKPIKNCEVRFVFGRIQFGDSGINAPFPNAVVIFRNTREDE